MASKTPNHPVEAAFALFDENVKATLNGIDKLMQNLDELPEPKQAQLRKNPIPVVPPAPPQPPNTPRII
jgi:hypothetical protein